MIELGKRREIHGTENPACFRPLLRQGRPTVFPMLAPGWSVVAAYNQSAEGDHMARLILCENLEDMQMLDAAFRGGGALALTWYAAFNVQRAVSALFGAPAINFLVPGTKVRTLTAKHDDQFTAEGQATRQWGVKGKVVGHHDSHGLCYVVKHADGAQSVYDPDEIEAISGR